MFYILFEVWLVLLINLIISKYKICYVLIGSMQSKIIIIKSVVWNKSNEYVSKMVLRLVQRPLLMVKSPDDRQPDRWRPIKTYTPGWLVIGLYSCDGWCIDYLPGGRLQQFACQVRATISVESLCFLVMQSCLRATYELL